VFVLLLTDNGESRSDARLEAYNRFMNDFLARAAPRTGS
jgi:hypothetical protein